MSCITVTCVAHANRISDILRSCPPHFSVNKFFVNFGYALNLIMTS